MYYPSHCGPINSVRSSAENNSGLTVDNKFILGFVLIMKAITYVAFQAEQAKWLHGVLSKSELRFPLRNIYFWYFNVKINQPSFPIDLDEFGFSFPACHVDLNLSQHKYRC